MSIYYEKGYISYSNFVTQPLFDWIKFELKLGQTQPILIQSINRGQYCLAQ